MLWNIPTSSLLSAGLVDAGVLCVSLGDPGLLLTARENPDMQSIGSWSGLLWATLGYPGLLLTARENPDYAAYGQLAVALLCYPFTASASLRCVGRVASGLTTTRQLYAANGHRVP